MTLSDPCSSANIDALRTLKLDIQLTADFDRSVLKGHVDLTLKVEKDNVNQIILDVRDLTVHQVSQLPSNSLLTFSVEDAGALGGKLIINTNEVLKDEVTIRVEYETSPQAEGLQWLPPAQTEGKQYGYMFSQFQAIHCRTTIPSQDSPAIKAPYTARIVAPKPLTALMSANSLETIELDDSHRAFTFSQPVPIPAYLIAIVVGALESREIGPRSRVWAEKEMVDRAAYEFAETEQYLSVAEELLTPYEWGRYDLLCLPSSFPYGGMENPCLTFVTPTLLAGDRSLSGVVAHEIAHSWTGNLVTNSSWENFWLNEGFTVFVERKILGRIFGEKVRQFNAILGNTSLKESVDHFGHCHNYSTLVPKLDGVNPDDSFSSVPYERGFQLLYYLEIKVGGAAAFEPFLKKWVEANKFKSVSTDEFISFFNTYFADKVEKETLDSIDWNAWLNQPGMPPVNMLEYFDPELAVNAGALATKWVGGEYQGNEDDIKGWGTNEIVYFLEKIVLDSPDGLSHERIARMEEVYHFSRSKNSEIRTRWYQLQLASKYEPGYAQVAEFLGEQGRMKFVRPLYRKLNAASEKGRALALETFEKYKNGYNLITKNMVMQDLAISK